MNIAISKVDLLKLISFTKWMMSDCLFLDLLTMYASKANWRLLSGVTDRSSLIFAAPKHQHKLLNTDVTSKTLIRNPSEQPHSTVVWTIIANLHVRFLSWFLLQNFSWMIFSGGDCLFLDLLAVLVNFPKKLIGGCYLWSYSEAQSTAHDTNTMMIFKLLHFHQHTNNP